MVKIVMPKCRRLGVLDTAHRGLAGGHFSEKRTFLSISLHFWWRKSVKKYCTACQRGGKAHSRRVPLQKTPTISVPYSRMACDIVGPLPRTQAGFRYILTARDQVPLCHTLETNRCQDGSRSTDGCVLKHWYTCGVIA